MDVDHHIATRLRCRRRIIRLTQAELGERAGVSFQQISKYESGANTVSAARLWQLARALEVPAAYFYEGLDEPRPPQ